jgi:hypothetical protein
MPASNRASRDIPEHWRRRRIAPFKYHLRLRDRGLPLRYRRRVRSPLPRIDDGVRRRLTSRFGAEVGAWFDELPAVLSALAEHWQVEFDSLIPRGSMSVVIRCRMTDGRPAVLKVGPDRTRIANEAAALDRWTTVHTPSLAVDESVGALLIEAIEPGTPLIESLSYPDMETTADLLTSLHANGVPDPSYPPLEHHVTYLFNSGTRPYERHPELLELIPPELYEHGRQLATRLAQSVPPTASCTAT